MSCRSTAVRQWRTREHQEGGQAHRGGEAGRERRGRRGLGDGRHDGRAHRPRAAGHPPPAAAGDGHPPHRGRAHLDVAARDGDHQPGRPGEVVHRAAGGPHHGRGARQGAHRRRGPAPHPRDGREGPCRDRRGLPGVTESTNDVTTLGRGGSDTTAVALAAGLGADVCEIYTDVDGVFTADPRIVPTARKIDRITYEEMLEMAASGAKVLALRCVEYGRRYGVPIHVRSSFSGREGTFVSADAHVTHALNGDLRVPVAVWDRVPGTLSAPDITAAAAPEEAAMEAPIISGVAHDRSEAKITVVGVPDVPGKAARLFEVVASSGVNIDMIVQNVSAARTGLTDISFTLPEGDAKAASSALSAARDELGFESLQIDDQIGKLSLVGAGMRSHPGVSAKFFAALRDADINIEMISTSEIRISVVTREDKLDDAVRAVHSAFDLDGEGEAVVYAGTGR
ncbi:aspartate kinase [Cellulosimicrobium sp. CUA-896]|uniref:aspartate kinase n=1 Tax=Cellulosimicrobium sp. CUA-896 TaxID=1517881 RepID=UPI003512FB1B